MQGKTHHKVTIVDRDNIHETVLFTDEHGKHIVHDDGHHRISVNNPHNASYVALYHNKGDGEWKKRGELTTNTMHKDFGKGRKPYQSVAGISIDKPLRGRRLGHHMYKALLDHLHPDSGGIFSNTSNRTNKTQVPKIYKRMGAVTHDGDYQVIHKPPATE
jgi:hypothetical protein